MTVFNVSSGDLTKTMMPTVSKSYTIYQILTIVSDNFLILCSRVFRNRIALVIITVSSSGEFINSTEPIINLEVNESSYYFRSADYDAESNTVYIGGQLDYHLEVILVYNFTSFTASIINNNTKSWDTQLASGCMNSQTYYLMDLTKSGNYTLEIYDININTELPTLSVVGIPQDSTSFVLCYNNQVYVASSSLVTLGDLSLLQINLQTGEASKLYESSADVISTYNYWVYENYFTQMVEINNQYYLITVDFNRSVIVYQVEITKFFVVEAITYYIK
ncbi:hypothetical protein DLAC_00839 [Tieghemostelium lacteum]|uniref:Uncharacterized protein n=1 Tax=Tieghemostelium lacteum TaxID=361077 RepID=A0A152A727_TIELA|nr:hypothetical protein DLAC_00839 [Tieghemostelium lacteum]|eukprot:KYR02043.1 hypothetical protein DLAC_00839 [Tieghemostelium lacteum]